MFLSFLYLCPNLCMNMMLMIAQFIKYIVQLIFQMSLIEESYLHSLLAECNAYFGREEKEAKQAVSTRLTEVYRILTRNIKYTFEHFSLETIVHFMELTVQIDQKFKYAEDFVNLFFQRITAPSQFFIRALLVKAKFIAYNGHKAEEKGQAMVNILKESIQEISRALDLIAGPGEVPKGKDSKGGADPNKGKYSFLVYNASTCLYKITRFMLRQQFMKNFTEIYERIYKLFQEFDEPDQNWRCQFTLILFQCLYDNDKKPDAFKILDLLWERAKSKNYDNLDSLFRLRVHLSKQNNALTNIIKKDIQGPDPNGWKILQVLQRMKSGAIPEAQIEKQLMGLVNQISLGVLSSNQQNSSVTLSPVMQQRLGQAGRIALRFNIVNIAQSITTFLGKVRQPNQKAMVLNEYNKAELMIKKKSQFLDKKTGMMMNSSQIKELQVESRKEAIRVLEKVMIINKKLANPDLIYEGAVLIWNTILPFMCPQYKNFIGKALDISVQLLEQIDSVDHDLRTKMHLQLAKIYFGNQQMFPQVEKNILRAIKLDHSIPIAKLQFKFQPEEDPSLYHRPYDRYLQSFRDKIMLKTMQNMNPHPLDIVVTDLWNVVEQKSETARIDTLQKSLRTILSLQEEEYKPDLSKMLVQEQIKQEKIVFEQKKLHLYKKKKLLAAQIAELAFEWQLNDFAKKAADLVLADTWEAKNAIQLIIAQSKCCYFVGQIKIDQLVQQNFEVPLTGPIVAQTEDGQNMQITQQKKEKIEEKKKSIFQIFEKGLSLAESIQQHWLVFNGGVYIWNNFLHIFRNPVNDSQLHPQLAKLLKKFFETMKNSLKQIQTKGIVYYDLDTKIQTFANIGLMNARLMENSKQTDEVIKICEALLANSLSPHTRKLINSIKARVGGGKAPAGKDQKKGGKDAPPEKAGGYNDTFLFEIFSQLEIIQNSTNKVETQNLIKKCFQSLQTWQPKQKDETQLELHAQLWARLSRLAVNENNVQMLKYAIRCADYSLSLLDAKNISNVPANRLRWYSLAEFLYSECLLKISNPQTQDAESYDKLLFGALGHAVEATHKGFKSSINALVIDGAKQVWNICSRLQDSQKNRNKLIIPIKTVLQFLREIKEDGEVDLVLLLAQLFFRAANENNENKIGEQVADMLFPLIPKNLQKQIWEAKMVFMSKQGKNELQAISNMKEADPSLQAKLWVKLARISVNPKKQYAAYNKAIEILKKENSVQIVQVLMEYAEWQLRVGNQKIKNVSSNLFLASDYLIDIEFGEEDDEQEGDGEQDRGTIFSRSTRGKKSHTSKSIKSSMKDKPKKPSQKKGTSSNKSKAGSNVSRMNRSGRVAKTIKSKNAKSIFSQREEDPNPETLNCIHFERLFRIHTMLAMISDNVTHRIRYALDAKRFLIEILQISLKTLNSIQQNALKLSQKGQKQENMAKYKLPVSLKEWVNLQLGKDFIDKIKILEDANFMGTYSFEKPELTFTYMRHLVKILNSYGLNFHAIPVIYMEKLFAAEILGNKLFTDVAELEMTLCLKKIGYEDSQKPEITKINSTKYRISEAEKKAQNSKSQSKIVGEKSGDNMFQNSIPANLIKPFSNHQAWQQIGKLLIEFGQINSAKLYLKQALQHQKILGNQEAAGECCIYLLWIASCEGENGQAMEYAVTANKLCKSIENWQKLLYYSCRFLLRLKKYEQIQNFASKIYETVTDLVVGLSKENSQKNMFESEIIELKDILILVELIDLQLRFTESIEEQLSSGSVVIISAIKQIDERLFDEGLWKLKHYQFFHKICKKIIDYFIYGEDKSGCLSRSVFDKLFSLLIKIEKKLFEIMKYVFVGSNSEFKSNQLIQTYYQYRFLLASAYAYQSIIDTDEDFNDENQEQRDTVMGMSNGEEQQRLKKFMKTLDKQIREKMKPQLTNLPPIESSISILSNLKSNIDPKSYQMVEWKALHARSLTLKAKQLKQLQELWHEQDTTEVKNEENEDQEDLTPNAALSRAAYEQLSNQEFEDQLLNYSKNNKSFQIAQLAFEAFVENCGDIPDQGIEYLSKLQHCSYNSKVLNIVRANLSAVHRFNSYLQLIEEIRMDPVEIEKVLNSNKIYKALTTFPNYDECLALMPRNSVYVILQLNLDHSEIFCGLLINEKCEDEYKCRAVVKRNKIQKSELQAYVSLRTKINKIKKEIAYLAYSEESKLEELIDQKQKILQDLRNKLDFMSQWWLIDLLQILNSVKESNQPQQADKGKKAAKDTKKKGGKDDVAGYQSPLGATPAGFESLVFLVDDMFEGLPFDQLSGLQKVPAISFDSSLFYLSRKMQALGFKADANNSNGFGADKGKYVSFDFKDPEISFKALSSKVSAQSPSIKFDGISSSDRVPSLGDFSKWLSQNGFLQVYGSLDFLNHLKIPFLVENAGTNKLRLLIVMDHLNYKKSLINKFLTLDGNSLPNSIDNQSRVLSAVVNLLDINMIKNNWTATIRENQEIVKGIYKNLGAGYYLGAANNIAQGEAGEGESVKQRRLYEKMMNKIHGCPVVRM